MFDYLEQLRQKPMSVRKRMAMLVSGACTALFAIIWFTTAPISYTSKEDKQEKGPGPFTSLKNVGATVFNSVSTEYTKFKKEFTGTTTAEDVVK